MYRQGSRLGECVSHSMAPKKKGGAKKDKKSTKEVAQESAGVLWLMEKTGFDKKELVRPELRPELPAAATPAPCVLTASTYRWRCADRIDVAVQEGCGR